MNDNIREQILAIRATGKTNMLNINVVQRLAQELNFYELVCFIEDNRKSYSNFILTGNFIV